MPPARLLRDLAEISRYSRRVLQVAYSSVLVLIFIAIAAVAGYVVYRLGKGSG